MRKPIYIRPLTKDEQQTLQEGLRSSNAFVLRRCQILLASARGQRARVIAHTLVHSQVHFVACDFCHKPQI